MNIRASSPVWPSFPVAASPQLVVSCSWHRGICYLIACLFVKWLAPADVPMWEFGGQHLYTNSRLHHCSAFDLVMMGHHPGHKGSSKTDLRMNFLILFFLPPKLYLIICSVLRSSACVPFSFNLCFPFIVVVAVAIDLSLQITRNMTGASVPSWFTHANWEPQRKWTWSRSGYSHSRTKLRFSSSVSYPRYCILITTEISMGSMPGYETS